jgi:cytochrome c
MVDEARQFAIDAARRKRYAYLIRNELATLAAGVAFAVSTSMSAHASSCDAALGEQVFEKCSACHSLVAGQHMMGPSLNGLNGRKAGTVDGFNFSIALRDSGIIWNDVTLNAFLKSPQSFISGTVMPFGGIQNATERAALVCYLVSR